MVQFNLLPDVKLEYAKTQKTKRMIMLATISITALAVFIFVLMFLVVNVFQKNHLDNLKTHIGTTTKEINDVPDLEKVLTVQNQLKALPGLHESKPAAGRITDYLMQITPNDAKITDVDIDFAANTMTINGSAGSLETINRFADTLKFTDYKEGETQKRAFSEVVLPTFGVAKDDGRVAYGLSFKFDPIIFDNKVNVQLIVPSMITTRSVTEKPTELFEQKSIIPPGQQ